MDSPLRHIVDEVVVSGGNCNRGSNRKFHLKGPDGEQYCDRTSGELDPRPLDAYPPGFYQPEETAFCSLCLAKLLRELPQQYEIYEPHTDGDKDYPELSMEAGAD